MRDSIYAKEIKKFKELVKSLDILKSNQELMDGFLNEIEISERSLGTQRIYAAYFFKLAFYFPKKKWEDLSQEDIVGFVKHLKDERVTMPNPFLGKNVDFMRTSEAFKDVVVHDKFQSYVTLYNSLQFYKKMINWIWQKRNALEEGETAPPVRFINGKNYSKPDRSKDPNDLPNQADIELLLANCVTPQEKCILMMLLDTGFRRSELASLKIGDVKKDDYGWKAHFKGSGDKSRPKQGKTGKYGARLSFSVPYFLQHKEHHPFKSDDDAPLFYYVRMKTPMTDSGLYETLKRVAKRSGIKKRIFCHLMRGRHARDKYLRGWSREEINMSQGRSKNSNLAMDYVRLNEDDVDKRALKDQGILVEDESGEIKFTSKECSNCGEINKHDALRCSKCNISLDLKEALKELGGREYEISELKKQITEMQTKYEASDPRFDNDTSRVLDRLAKSTGMSLGQLLQMTILNAMGVEVPDKEAVSKKLEAAMATAFIKGDDHNDKK